MENAMVIASNIYINILKNWFIIWIDKTNRKKIGMYNITGNCDKTQGEDCEIKLILLIITVILTTIILCILLNLVSKIIFRLIK